MRHVFRTEAQRLDPLDVFVTVIVTRDRANRIRTTPATLELGERKTVALKLQPTGRRCVHRTSAVAEAIAHIYNDEYWLFSLWEHLARHAQGSALAREITRGFIKHCIFVTTEYVLTYSPESVDKRAIEQHARMNTITFYKRIFAWSAILKCMSSSARTEVRARLVRAQRPARDDDYAMVRATIPELKTLFREHDLPEAVVDAAEQPEDLHGIVDAMKRTYTFFRDRSEIRRRLERLVLTS